MTIEIQEIINFKSGVDLSLDPILSPSDAFINLRNGFVHRGVLKSRNVFRHFADGNDSTTRDISRVSNDIEDEDVGDSVNANNQSFTLNHTQIERSDIVVSVIDSFFGALSITIAYLPADRTVTFTGNVFSAGTNSINYETGDIAISFDSTGVGGPLNGDDSLLVTYSYHPDFAIMGIHEFVRSSGVRELVVFDQDFPYTFDASNNDFDKIDFEGATAPTVFMGGTDNFFTFQNWRLNSKGVVPAAADTLVLNDMLFFTNNIDVPMVYNGTDIRKIAEMEDSNNKNPYRAPLEGALVKALHVVSYGERLCWLRPTLGSLEFAQAVLWGPINNQFGLGLDYRGSGSGLLSAVTNSRITGFKFLRDTLIVFFETDIYALELTDDNFQPFRWTKIEDERGSEATHGAVGFLGAVESPGRLGIMSTTGRRTRRSDNKIPNFTRDHIDPDQFSHIFGEEMEEDSQFWWSYPELEDENITTSNKVLIKNFEEESYSVYDIAISVLNKTILGLGKVWDNLPDTFNSAQIIWNKWGFDSARYKTIFGDHHGFIFAVGDALSDGRARISPSINGPTISTNAITLGLTTTIETEFHHFRVNDVVTFRDIVGTTELNDIVSTVITVPDRSSIIVDKDSSSFTAWTSGGEVLKLIDFEAEFVPFNPFRSKGRTCYLGRMDFLVKSGTGEYIIDFFENRENEDWSQPSKTFTFTSDNSVKFDRWFGIYVDNTADFHRWTIKQKDIGEQCNIKSIRIFYSDGGESNV